jgi:replicative DNA helicase
MSDERRSRPAGNRAASATAADDYSIDDSVRQLAAVGPAPGIDELFVGALLYSTVVEVRDVARFVDQTDLDEPGATVFVSVVALAGRGVPPSPQLVADDLKRNGCLTRSRAVWLASCTASGACASAARHYASAVVAESLRRQVESFGASLVSAAESASEDDIAQLVERASARVRYAAGRLAELRGE